MSEITEWVSVGALGEAFRPANHSLETVADLGGRSLSLQFENGWSLALRFVDGGTLRWERTDAEGGGASGAENYTATSPRGGIYFVDFVQALGRAACVSLVLDFTARVATGVFGTMPTREEAREPFLEKIQAGKRLTSVTTNILRGSIGPTFLPDAPHHRRTTELLGKRVRYVYSPTETYEHLYLNPDFYTWHCLKGIERGLCDTDYCHYFRIEAELYLFVWQEKIVPTLGVVMIDLAKRKTTGKIFGYAGYDFQELTNFAVGAYATVVQTLPAPEQP